MTTRDLARYEAIRREPTKIGYRGLDVYGMGPPSSGGSTVGEALNILEGFPPPGATRDQALHRYLEASKLAYADRNEYLADPAYDDVPLRGLLSDAFARDRRALIKDDSVLPTPQPADPDPYRYEHGHGHGKRAGTGDNGKSTTHLTVADRWGNVVSYTFTIEQIGGSGIVVPGRGFLLNNELTDFNFADGHGELAGRGQAAALEHGADDRVRRRPAGGRARLAGRRDDHHHRPADARQPPRLRDEPARRGGGAAGVAAQRRLHAGRARRSSTTWRGAEEPRGHTFTDPPDPGELGAVAAIRFRGTAASRRWPSRPAAAAARRWWSRPSR